MHAAPVWLPMVLAVTAAVLVWLAIYKPRRRVSLLSLLVLVTLLAVAFAYGRLWGPRGAIEVLPAPRRNGVP